MAAAAPGNTVPQAADLATEVVALLRRQGLSVATAESLTGGLVCAALTSVPGASAVVRGGIVAYAAQVKISLLGVPADLVRTHGTVSTPTAVAMAAGARRALGADVAVATTGVAGPEPSEGKPVGTVHVAVSGAPSWEHLDGTAVLSLAGSREQIRDDTVHAVLGLLRDRLSPD